MCDFLCVAIAADVDPKPRLERADLRAEECTGTPAGRAVMTVGKRQRAYFITHYHCSCDLFPTAEDLRRPSRRHRFLPLRDGVLALIRELVEEQHSVPLLRHLMCGNAWTEEVTPQRKVKLPVAELESVWGSLERDVRYVVVRD